MQRPEESEHRAWRRHLFAVAIAAFAGLVYLALMHSPGLLDWDTYGRLLFIEHAEIGRQADGHLLFHVWLNGLLALGLSPAQAVFSSTALSLGLLLAAGVHVARARGLEGRTLAIVIAALVVASPGVLAMTLMAEDNVTYLAPLLLFFHWLTTPRASSREELVAGVKAAAMLAIAMLLNITALIFLFALPLAAVLWALRRRGDATRLSTAIVGALGIYYLVHLVALSDAPIAMHEFLPQALSLQDFEQSSTPLFSGARIGEYVGGFRAMALTPTIHMMALPYWLTPVATLWAPVALLGAYGLLLIRASRRAKGGASRRWREGVLGAGLVALALAFPFFYEPTLIERWDMLWLLLWLGLVVTVRSGPRGGAEVVLALILLIQVAGSSLVVAHHFGRAYERPDETELRSELDGLLRDGSDPIVLPNTEDRLLVAYLAYRLPGRRLYLIDGTEAEAVCIHVAPPLREVPVSCAEVSREISEAERAHVDWRAAPHVPELTRTEGAD